MEESEELKWYSLHEEFEEVNTSYSSRLFELWSQSQSLAQQFEEDKSLSLIIATVKIINITIILKKKNQ